MSHKRAKMVRQSLRADGVAVGDARYVGSRLDPKCGRAHYHRVKHDLDVARRPPQVVNPRPFDGVPSAKQESNFKGFRKDWTPGPVIRADHPQGPRHAGGHRHSEVDQLAIETAMTRLATMASSFRSFFVSSVNAVTAGLKDRYQRRPRAARGG